MKIGRVIWFFVIAFSSVIIPVVVASIVIFGDSEPRFSVDSAGLARARDEGLVQDANRRFSGTASEDRYQGAGANVILFGFPDNARARDAFDSLVGSIETRSLIQTTTRVTYTTADGSTRGRVARAGSWVLWGEAQETAQIEAAFGALPFLEMRRREAPSPALIAFAVIVTIAYITALVFTWPRIASWASRVDGAPGVSPVSEDELRSRLLAINDTPAPLTVEQVAESGELVGSWRYADARWAGPLHSGGITRLARVRMRLDCTRARVRIQDQTMQLDWGVGISGRASVSIGGFRGIVFGAYERGRGAGLVFRNGRLVYDQTYNYRFSAEELKGPIAELVTQSGWDLVPVVTLGKERN
jgi:hypothetical protein